VVLVGIALVFKEVIDKFPFARRVKELVYLPPLHVLIGKDGARFAVLGCVFLLVWPELKEESPTGIPYIGND
jgi:hypothetical protein